MLKSCFTYICLLRAAAVVETSADRSIDHDHGVHGCKLVLASVYGSVFQYLCITAAILQSVQNAQLHLLQRLPSLRKKRACASFAARPLARPAATCLFKEGILHCNFQPQESIQLY